MTRRFPSTYGVAESVQLGRFSVRLNPFTGALHDAFFVILPRKFLLSRFYPRIASWTSWGTISVNFGARVRSRCSRQQQPHRRNAWRITASKMTRETHPIEAAERRQ